MGLKASGGAACNWHLISTRVCAESPMCSVAFAFTTSLPAGTTR
jgi:hypothetical protein